MSLHSSPPHRQHGATLVELAIVIVLFLVLVTTAFDIFRVFNTQLCLQHAVTEGARRSVIEQPEDAARVAVNEATAIAKSLGVSGVTFSTSTPSYPNLNGNWLHLEGSKTVTLTPLGNKLLKLGGVYKNGYLAKYAIDVRLEN